jgi:hypothetical protein
MFRRWGVWNEPFPLIGIWNLDYSQLSRVRWAS